MQTNDLKKKMKSGASVYGIFINSGSTIACEIAGLAGYDFAIIDSEHGPTTDSAFNRDLVCACEYRGTAPIIRVPNGDYDTILKNLDIGAHGVMVPQVNSVDKAEEVVNAALYCPDGNRGVATTRSSDYGFETTLSSYFEKANERNLVIVQCENNKCLPVLGDICSVKGIDVLFLGPYDLSSSMRTPGKVDYESIKDIVHKVINTTAKHGVAAGIFTKSSEEAKFYEKLGFKFIILGTDIAAMANTMKADIKILKG